MDFDPVLLTGDPVIDAQHQELFAHVAALQAATRERRSQDEVGRLLDYLADYVASHFATEEQAMRDADYPALAAHRAEHAHFAQELAALRDERLRGGGGALFVIRVGNRVTAWLREHVYRTDRALGEWLRSHPRRA